MEIEESRVLSDKFTSFGELLFSRDYSRKADKRDLIIKWIIGIPPRKIARRL
jgi:hypothetical protein